MGTRPRVAVLVSGNGSNLQALLDGASEAVDFVLVVSNKPGVYALERAAKAGVASEVVKYEDFPDRASFTQAILELMRSRRIDLICLAGFNRILDKMLADAFPMRIMNTHPALLPAFGGAGMYGRHVHEAVLASGAKLSGATVHFATAEADRGPIILQAAVPVLDDDTPDSLARRILPLEHRLYPAAVRLFAAGRLRVDGNRVRIAPG